MQSALAVSQVVVSHRVHTSTTTLREQQTHTASPNQPLPGCHIGLFHTVEPPRPAGHLISLRRAKRKNVSSQLWDPLNLCSLNLRRRPLSIEARSYRRCGPRTRTHSLKLHMEPGWPRIFKACPLARVALAGCLQIFAAPHAIDPRITPL